MLNNQSQRFTAMKWKTLISSLLAFILLLVSVAPALAASPGKTVNASAKLAYNLKGLKFDRAVQKAYIADKYVYVTQRVNGTCHLSRLLIKGSDAQYVDHMTITNSGHCQTLDMYTYNGANYFYFSSKADPSTSTYWSLQVARLQYSAGKTVDYTDLHRFTYMNYANKKGSKQGTTYRVDGGGNSSYTVFRIQTRENKNSKTDKVVWSVYDTAALNRLLDQNKQVRMDSSAAIKAAVSSFTQSGSGIIRPNGSFQGADLLGKTQIFTSGGAEGDTPQIAKISSSGTYQTLVKITNVGKHEIEGVQTKNGNVYFTIVSDPGNKKNGQKIYYVPDSIF
ncbi:hypothetical protein HUB98_22305 [Paenibacillus barcinonensis]|uniref:Uncharacterized protein n=1 Tax=Paenibacillus barcinonensis TaxID=198119 RepID=A0A2V4V7K6_PAEBA|nr:helveticin J family class III bacteriocin [Paenibacillus barcinonensis]PYE48630.1 hypothetical protein DFQ00_108222 [Paenibacillus barcinonensis]QKS58689.1 hypothetical protein HUB98_22305 [Paenibacillus barcinonensis]